MKAREVAVNVLRDVEVSRAKSDTALNRYFQSEQLENLDKALVMQVVYGSLREKMKLDHVLKQFYKHDFEKMDVDVKNILRIAVYQLMFLTKVPTWAAVNESVELAKSMKSQFLANLVNGVLRNVVNNLETLDFRIKGGTFADQLALKHSHPRWLLERWMKTVGFTEAEQLMEANNQTPTVAFRINRLRHTPESFFALLETKRVGYRPSAVSGFFTPDRFFDVQEWLLKGDLSVQSESQGLACRLLAPHAGMRVLDMCAAPGGKSTHLAELMTNTGSITAIDLYENKLKSVADLAAALGITIIQTVETDGRAYKPDAPFDAVLLDAPCTGTGVLARRAELRWRLSEKEIKQMAALQSELLESAAACVKPGGVMVYATCSLEPEENQEQVEGFLSRHADWKVESAKAFVPAELESAVTEFGAIQIMPHLHHLDGAFSVRLVRK